ncbi:WRKY transcription factor 55 [Fagus crenata]
MVRVQTSENSRRGPKSLDSMGREKLSEIIQTEETNPISLIQKGCKLARELEVNLQNLTDQPNMISKSCDEIIQVFGTAKERLYSTEKLSEIIHMEETNPISLIQKGCKLARELEVNLQNLTNQPNMISKSCDEIIQVFGTAKERLYSTEKLSEIIHMEETNPISLIQKGCKLARELEVNLQNLTDQPNMISKSCDEIIQVFGTAKERLYSTEKLSEIIHMEETNPLSLIQKGNKLAREFEANLQNLTDQPNMISKSCDEIIQVFGTAKGRLYSTEKLSEIIHMEETNPISLIQKGCKLARELEVNLPNLTDQPNMISKSCDEIIKVLGTAKEKLYSTQYQDPISLVHMMIRQAQAQESQQAQIEGAGDLRGWLSSNFSQAMDILQTQFQAERSPFNTQELGSGMGSSSSQRQRRRRDDGKRETLMVPAPRIGNTEIPPEDGYTWRKYGQKEILNSKFPRCTHQKLYQCPAKKLVQRLDDDPFTFEVTYRNSHICHMSSTAPSIPPPPSVAEMTHDMASQPPSCSSVPLSNWLSIDSLGGGGGGSSASGMVVGGGGGAGPSTTRTGKELEYPVADLADAMFNSGSSSSNSMDFLFQSPEDNKWKPGDKQC